MSVQTAGSSVAPARSQYIAFAPWVVFGIIARRVDLQVAAGVALAAAIVVSWPSLQARRPKILEVAGIVVFAVFLVIALVTGASNGSVLARYCRAFAAGALALVAFGSLMFIPFTEQYARESVPRALWSSARFKQTNRLFTTMWGCVFLAMVVSHVIAGSIDTTRGETIFNYLIPIGLVVLMFRWMARYRSRPPTQDAGGSP